MILKIEQTNVLCFSKNKHMYVHTHMKKRLEVI